MLTEKRNRKGTVYHEENGEIIAKSCAKCNEIKTLNAYTKHKSGLGGRESACKDCKAGYYAENKESYIERYDANREHLLELNRIYSSNNKERLTEYRRNYYAENRETYAEHNRLYWEANKEHMKELTRKWRRNNPEKDSLIANRRRARKNALPDDFTSEQMQATFDYFGGCVLTGDVTEIHWDHVVPLASGHGGTTFGNMIPLRSDLNISKNDANIFEWFNRNKDRFNLSQERFDRLVEWLAEVNGMTADDYRDYVYECSDEKEAI